MPATSTSAAGDQGWGCMGPQAQDRAAPHSIVGGCSIAHAWAPCNTIYAVPGHIHGCCPSQRCPDMDTCARGTTAHTLSHTVAWAGVCHRHTHAQPGVHMQNHGHCKGSSGKPALARNAHAAHTYTNSILPLSQQPEVQTNSHAHTPTSPPASHPLLSVPRGNGL